MTSITKMYGTMNIKNTVLFCL